jgi:tRNA pseudouridine38-40 synthase
VSVLDLAVADAGFHPRYSARSRTYEYTVAVANVRRPLERRYAWLVRPPLDVRSMNEAAGGLIGEFDFVAFGTAPKGDVTVRRVMQAEWHAVDDPGGLAGAGGPWPHRLVFCIEANAFLFRMVRRIVRVLTLVGQGNLSAGSVGEILASKDPQRVKGMAPACGLCLVKVTY